MLFQAPIINAANRKHKSNRSSFSKTPKCIGTAKNQILPILTDLKSAWLHMDIPKKHAFIRWVSDQNLSYTQGKYRTPSVDPIFQHNLLKVKEKGLLISEQPCEESGTLNPSSS